MIQKYIFFDNMIFIAIVYIHIRYISNTGCGDKKRLYYLFKYIRIAGSWNNSVLASRRFPTFDWVPISLIYLLGPWLLLNTCPCSVQSFAFIFLSSWVLKLTAWIPHFMWPAWVSNVIWPAWIPLLYDLLGSPCYMIWLDPSF